MPGETNVSKRHLENLSTFCNLIFVAMSTGRYMSGGVFDVKATSVKSTELRDFLQSLPNKVIILMAVQESGNANSNLNDAISAMRDVGVNNTAVIDNESFAAVLYKGPGDQSWIQESKNTVGNGPSFVTVSIPVPYGYIPDGKLNVKNYFVFYVRDVLIIVIHTNTTF
jgi:hypothetical protein